MALVEIKNHADLAVGLLLEQLKGKEKLEAFLRALVGPIQDMEEVAHDLDTEMRLDNAAGAQLDMIGRIVKLARGPLGDEAYRTRLHARIRANRSEGTPDDVLAVLRLMVASNGISIEEYPTGMVARVADTLAEDPDALVAELRRARPGAVPLHLEYNLVDDTDTFTFADGDSEEADSSAGFSGMRWIAVGDAFGGFTYVVYTDDVLSPSSWSVGTGHSASTALRGVAWDGSGVLIAVGNDNGTDSLMLRSTDDGETWAAVDLPDSAVDLNAVTYSPDLNIWVAVGDDAGTESLVFMSDDSGLSWTAQSNPDDAGLNGVVWCPSLALFIAVGNQGIGDAYLITSPDGETWTERVTPKNSSLRGICWNEDLGLAVAVGDSDGADGYIITSPDGINWTERANPKNLWLYGVCWSETLQLFVAVGDPDTDTYVVTSPDGISWIEQNTAPCAVTSYGVGGLGQYLLAANDTDGSGSTLSSEDGTTWTKGGGLGNYALFAAIGIQRQSLGGAWSYVKEA